jgi:hypothetical protein
MEEGKTTSTHPPFHPSTHPPIHSSTLASFPSSILPFFLLLLAVLAFWQVARRQEPLVQARRDFHLSKGEPLENTPPLVAFTTVALGGFRGIIADLLWLRSSQLQQEGKYFELVQLADWITKLQPRLAQVWAYHGWNMSYNVSVLFDDPADRWRWVRRGIALLRDEGLYYNPGDSNLYRELSWIYLNKLAGNLDQMNVFYKRWWAMEMQSLFDGPQPDYDHLPAETADRMRREYKLDPARMRQADEKYGPLDWRLPQAHAIYWAWRGKPHARGFEAVQIDRMIFQAMADAALQGSLFSNPSEDVFVPGPNFAIFDKARRAYEEAVAANPSEASLQSGHRNFLRTALMVLYTHHRLAEARDVLADLRTRYPSPEFELDLDAYVYRQLTAFLADIGQREALDMVSGALQQSWFWLALGDAERAQGFQQLARTIWREYMKQLNSPEAASRTGLPHFDELNAQARETIRATLRTASAKSRLAEKAP